jgi:hypothetical protein
MTVKLLNRDPDLDNIRQFKIFDDFIDFNTGYGGWTAVAHDASAAVAEVGEGSDAANGLITLEASNDNSECYVRTTNPVFSIKNDMPLVAIARLKINSEPTANQAAWVFGLMANPTANALADNEAGPATSNCCVMTMNSGATNAQNLGVVSDSTAIGTRTATSSEITVDENWYSLMITIEPVSATEKRACFYVDSDGGQNWKQLKDSNGNLIKHKMTYTEPAASTNSLSLFCGLKAAGSSNQVLTLDYMGAWQLRKSYPVTGTSTD